MTAERAETLALLIDGDNVSSENAATLIAEVGKYGTARVRRVYGDFCKPNLNGWRDCLQEYSIQPMQQFANTPGKNSTDIAMVIDAMDLLHTGRFSGFCIASSDGDFTRLAMRIREHGVNVYGFGNCKTPDSFRVACEKFVCLDAPNASVADDNAVVATLRKGIEAVADAGGKASLSRIGQYLKQNAPDLSYSQLHKLIESSEIADVERAGDGTVEFVRLRSSRSAA